MKKGRLIVIDGNDGSGKATQTKLLLRRFRKAGYVTKTLDFPQYEKNFFGSFLGKCLIGEYGDFVNIDPHIGSVLYAADRFESKNILNAWLKKGYIVVLDRYVSANQIHQGGKIVDARKRKKFLEWLDTMEHDVFAIPRPDIILYLDVPFSITKKLLKEKGQKQKKIYIRGKKRDTVEESKEYLLRSQENALKLVKRQNNWSHIPCMRKNELLPPEAISEAVWEKVQSLLKG